MIGVEDESTLLAFEGILDAPELIVPTTSLPPGPASESKVTLREICFYSTGPKSLPLLLAFLSTGDLLIYRSFLLPQAESNSSFSRLRLKKLKTTPITRSLTLEREACEVYANKNPKKRSTGPGSRMNDTWRLGRRLLPFSEISGRPAILVAGHCPLVITQHRGYPRAHPLIFAPPEAEETEYSSEFNPLERSRRGLACCAALHNPVTNRGIVAFTTGGVMEVGTLPSPSEASLATSLITSNMLLGSTIHSVDYHKGTDTLCLLVSREVKTFSSEEEAEKSEEDKEEKEETEGMKSKEETEKIDVGYPKPEYSVKVVSPNTFEEVGSFSDLEKNEEVLCQKVVTLSTRTFIALGTSKVVAEDTITKGRIILLEIYFATREDEEEKGEGKAKNKLSLRAYSQYEKGPVCCIEQMEGNLIIAVAAKVLMYQWDMDKRQLIGRGFYDCEIYIVKMRVMRNYLLAGDYCQGLHLIAWDFDMRLLVNVARDPYHSEVTDVEYAISGDNLGLVCANTERKLQVYRFLPSDEESRKGQKLLIYASTKLPVRTSSLLMLRARDIPSLEENKKRKQPGLPPPKPVTTTRSITLGACLEGGLYSLVPLDPIVHRRTLAVCLSMLRSVPMTAGINPLGARQEGSGSHRLAKAKQIVDGDLLWMYVGLSSIMQERVATNIGTTRDVVIENLLELQLATTLAA
ncbi:hypothetical protein AAMO2058_001055800 [Amorphochlora amoebiformis]